MLENLFGVRLFIKKQSDDDALLDCIKAIEQLTYPEKCAALQNELNKYRELAENTEQLKGNIAVCNYKIQQGLKLNKKLDDKIAAAEDIIRSCKEKFILRKITEVIVKLKIPEAETPIEEYSEFVFSPAYCQRVEQAVKEAYSLLDKQFESFIANIKCSYAQSSEFKKIYGSIVKQLSLVGRKNYSDLLKNRIDEVLQETELEHKYSSLIADAQRFISSTVQKIPDMNYEEISLTDKSINGWIETFLAATDMRKEERNTYLSKFNELKNRLIQRRNELDDIIQCTLSEIKKPTLDSAKLHEQIRKAMLLMPNEETVVILKNAMLLIEEFHTIKSKQIAVNYSAILELENELGSRWKGSVCEGYIQEFILLKKKQLDSKRADWMKKYVSDYDLRMESLTVNQCIQWQTVVSVLPDYLTNDDLEEVARLSLEISKKIKLHRINGVVDMFNALSDDERKECLQRILSQMKE